MKKEDVEIKLSKDDGKTQLIATLGDDLAIATRCEIANYHTNDSYRFERFILIPSKIDPREWDQLTGEKFISKVPYDTALANMYTYMKEMIEILRPN